MRLVLIAAIACAAFAQTGQTAQIEGRVVSSTGEPIPRVSLTLRFLMGQAANNNSPSVVAQIVSDNDGKFQIDQIKPAQGFRLMASRVGFLGSGYGSNPENPTSPFGAPFDLTAGQSLRGIVITMTPQGTITGRVTDRSGDPVPDAAVSLLRRGFYVGERQPLPRKSVKSNDLGEFRFSGVDPGRYYLAVRGDEGQIAGGKVGNVTTFYPNAADWKAGATVDVPPGANVLGADIRLRTEKLYSVQGSLVDLTGKPVAGAQVSAIPGTGAVAELTQRALNTSSATTLEDGSFRIGGLAPGSYWLSSVAPQIGGTGFGIKDRDIADVRIASGPGAAVSGRWILENGDIRTASPRPSVNLVAEAYTPPHLAADDGTFRAEGFRLVPHTLEIRSLPSGTYVKSARLDGQDVLRSSIDMTAHGPRTGTLEIVLALNAASVTGTVANEKGEPLEDVMVSVWPLKPLDGLVTGGVEMKQSGADGTFLFGNLAPGEYYVAAWETITGAIYNRSFLADFVQRATKIELREGSLAPLIVRPTPAAAIEAAEEKLR